MTPSLPSRSSSGSFPDSTTALIGPGREQSATPSSTHGGAPIAAAVTGICQRLWSTDSFLITSPVLPLPRPGSSTLPPGAGRDGMILASRHFKSPISIELGPGPGSEDGDRDSRGGPSRNGSGSGSGGGIGGRPGAARRQTYNTTSSRRSDPFMDSNRNYGGAGNGAGGGYESKEAEAATESTANRTRARGGYGDEYLDNANAPVNEEGWDLPTYAYSQSGHGHGHSGAFGSSAEGPTGEDDRMRRGSLNSSAGYSYAPTSESGRGQWDGDGDGPRSLDEMMRRL